MMRTKISLFTILVFVEGLIALALLFIQPSELENAWILGFSKSRMLLGGIFAIILFMVFIIGIVLFLKPQKSDEILNRANNWISSGNGLLIVVVSSIGTFLFGLIFLLLVYSPAGENLHTIKALINRSVGIYVWSLLVLPQFIVLLLILYPSNFRSRKFWHLKTISTIVVVLASVLLTAFQWLIFIFQDALFTAIPGWYWQFHAKPYSSNYLLFIPLVLITIGVLLLILKKVTKPWLVILFLMVLGFSLQVGFGWIEGGGFSSIKEKFLISGHHYYIDHTCDNTTAGNIVREYDQWFSGNFILGTKPPGGLLFYYMVHRSAAIINTPAGYDDCRMQLATVGSVLFPLLSMLSLPLLYVFTCRVLEWDDADAALVLLIVSPNILLMVMQLDQFLYPSLFLTGLLITHDAFRRQSILSGFLAGIFGYLAVFTSFSMITVVVFSVVWILIQSWRYRETIPIKKSIFLLSALIIGFLIMYLIFFFGFGYDALYRYQQAMILHKSLKLLTTDLRSMLEAAFINAVEFSFWSGIPIIILFLSASICSLRNWIRKQAGNADWFLLVFWGIIILLNFFGQTRSEVGRLWLFLLPIIVVFAAREIKRLVSAKKDIYLIGLVVMQLCTTMVTFLFQDFY